MAELRILEFDESNYKGGILARFCGEETDNKTAFKLGKQMVDLMVEAKGLGLAANQVGHLVQLMVISIKGKPVILYKPKIIKIGHETAIAEEGCLSLPGIFREISRPTEVKFSAIINKAGKRKDFVLKDLEARTFFHEFSHLSGTTILDERV